MRSTDAKQLEHGCLWFKDRATSNGANFYAWHGDGDVQIAVDAVVMLASTSLDQALNLLLHKRDTI